MTTRVVKREDSLDGNTTKLLIQLQDGQQVESVLMRYDNTITGGQKRTTLCVSSQVGCAMACTFCATGTMGILGSLCSGEILEQFIWANEIDRIRNVVFMGMGEPLQNYDAVLSAINAMTDPARFSLRKNRVTLSTVGVVNKMFQLIDTAPQITLALSLHAPTQEMREKIVPSAKQYSLDKLMEAIDYYYLTTGNQMLLEYVMLDDINCGEDTAHKLGQLLQGKKVMVNLIPFNPVLTKAQHIAPSVETCEKFASIVSGQYGVFTTLRKELGQDISGACGQLAVETAKHNKFLEKGKSILDNDDLLDQDVVANGLEGIVSAIGAMPSQMLAEQSQTTMNEINKNLLDLEDFVPDSKEQHSIKQRVRQPSRGKSIRISVEREMEDDIKPPTNNKYTYETDNVIASYKIISSGPITRQPDDTVRGKTNATKVKSLVKTGMTESEALLVVNQRPLKKSEQVLSEDQVNASKSNSIRRVFMPQTTKPILGPIEKHTTTVNPALRMPKTNVNIKKQKPSQIRETSDEKGIKQPQPVFSQLVALVVLIILFITLIAIRRFP